MPPGFSKTVADMDNRESVILIYSANVPDRITSMFLQDNCPVIIVILRIGCHPILQYFFADFNRGVRSASALFPVIIISIIRQIWPDAHSLLFIPYNIFSAFNRLHEQHLEVVSNFSKSANVIPLMNILYEYPITAAKQIVGMTGCPLTSVSILVSFPTLWPPGADPAFAVGFYRSR